MQGNECIFDEVVDRRGTNCGRWDTMDRKYNRSNMIHLGVADMDFKSPDAIIQSFQNILDRGVFGYTDLNDAFYTSIQSWMKRRHHSDIPREWIVFCPRINISAGICVETFTEENDEVIINTPSYGPLYQAVVKNHRRVLENPLIQDGTSYRVDFDHLEKIVTERTKMFVLCSPHNPTGSVWTKEELEKIGSFCKRHNLLLFVDEIHSDILAEGTSFVSAMELSETVKERLVLATSLTKTFNIPGVIVAYMVIPNDAIRAGICGKIDQIGMHNPTIFAVSAVESGYMHCDTWYEAMLAYINENERFTRAYFQEHFPQLTIMKRDATYLLWIDYRALGCSEEELEKWFLEEANVSVYMGTVFGEAGRGFIRMNIASPRSVLKEAFDRMARVYGKLEHKDIELIQLNG